MRVDYVMIAPETDGVQGLYIDGECVLAGDDYHDHIRVAVCFYLLGMKKMGWNGSYTEYTIDGNESYAKEFYEMAELLPERFTALTLKHFARKERMVSPENF